MSKFDQFDPIFFTPPSGKASGPRRLFKGGGGGGVSNPDTRYANLDALYGVQTQASQYMLDNAMPHIPRLTENSAAMVGEAMDGTLGNRMRGVAGADAEQALSANLAATDRNNAKYGAEFNPNRRAQLSRVAAVDGANVKANAMNKASQWSEDQKWNRNASMFGQVMGMNNGAMQGMSSATSGMTNIANQQAANDRANAAGYGQAGAAFSNALFKADGGFIKGGKSRGFGLRINSAKLANGGNAWEAYKAANPVKPMVSGSSGRSGGTNPYMAMLSGAAPGMLGAGLRDVMKGNKSGIIKTAKDVLSKGKTWVTSADQAQGASNTGLAFETNSDIVAGNMDTGASLGADVGTTAATELGSAAASAAATEAGVQVGSDVLAQSTMEALGSAAVQEGSQQAAMLAAQDAAFLVADGGYIPDRKKGRGLRLAMGGMPTMQKMSVADNSGVSGLDSNQSLSVARMDEAPKQPVLAKPAGTFAESAEAGKDPIEQSAKSVVASQATKAAISEVAGAGTASAAGTGAGMAAGTGGGVVAGAGGTGAGLAAGTGAGVTAGAAGTGAGLAAGTGAGITAGTAGGVAAGVGGGAAAGATAGSIVPVVGTIAGAVVGALASRYLARGGNVEPQQRADFKPGGDVQGPGTETSDDIPAWLSAGEIVENAEAVKLAGKDALLAINQAGRDVREGNASPQEARQEIGQVMIERGKQLAGGSIEAGIKQVARRAGERRGMGLKRGGCVPKLAGGGLLGGNLGIAMGAGVDQWNRQQQIDLQQRAADRQDKMMARQEKEWADQDALTDNIKTAVDDGNLRSIENYAGQQEDAAKASAASSGNTWAGPLTQDQRRSIAMAPGLRKMSPNIEYETNLRIADAYRNKGDLAKAEALSSAAEKKVAGHAVNAILGKDSNALRSIYHVFPNGDTPDDMVFDEKTGNLNIRRGDKTESLPQTKALLFALSRHDPEGVTKMLQSGELTEEKIRNMAAGLQQRMELGLEKIGLQREALDLRRQVAADRSAGVGASRLSSKRGSGDDADTGSVGIKDSDLLSIYDKTIPDDGFGGTLTKQDAIAQSIGRVNGMKKLNPGLDDHQVVTASIEATKYHRGLPTNGTVNLVGDGKGGFVPTMTIQEVTGNRNVALGPAMPYDALAGKAEEFKKRGIQMPSAEQVGRARIEWISESAAEAEKVARMFAQMTPEQINSLPPEQRKRMQNAGAEADRLREILKGESYSEQEAQRNLSRAPAPRQVMNGANADSGKSSRVGNAAMAAGHHAGKVIKTVGQPVVDAGSEIKRVLSEAGDYWFSPNQDKWRPQ